MDVPANTVTTGFTLNVTCVVPTFNGTIACQPVENPQIVSYTNGSIRSDIDGSGAALWNPLRSINNCSWRITCAEDQWVTITQVSADLAASMGDFDDLYIDDTIRMYKTTTISGVFTIRKAAVNILYMANTQLKTTTDPGTGFTVNYQCIPMNPLAPYIGCPHNSTILHPTTPVVVMSDLNGANLQSPYVSPVVGPARCSWTLICEADEQISFFNLTGSLPKNSVSFAADNFDPFTLFSIPQSTTTTPAFTPFVLPSSWLTFNFTVTDLSGSNGGVTLRLACIKQQLPSTGLCRPPTSPLVLSTSPFQILSDFDGPGYWPPITPRSCGWSIQCAVQEWVQFTGVATQIRAGVADSFQIGGMPIFAQTAAAMTIQSSSVNVSWNTVPGVDSNALLGFVMNFTCIPPTITAPYIGCPNFASAPITALNATILTDFDGAGMSYYMVTPFNCTWTVQCPAAMRVMIEQFSGDALNLKLGLKSTNYNSQYSLKLPQTLSGTRSRCFAGGRRNSTGKKPQPPKTKI